MFAALASSPRVRLSSTINSGCPDLADLVRHRTVNTVTVPGPYGELRQAVAPSFRPFGNLIRADKGKPVERQGRKATDLRAQA